MKKDMRVSSYHPNDQDKVRKTYMQKDICQPLSKKFSQRNIGGVHSSI